MSSLCCKAETRLGYINLNKTSNGLYALGIPCAICTKCELACDYEVDGQEYFTDGTPKNLPYKYSIMNDKSMQLAETNVINKTMKFELSPKEVQAYEKFLEKLPKKYRGKPIEIIFSTGNGIGTGITVRVGDKSEDITDYDTW